MDLNRKYFQGLTNIIRFNWHFYLFAILFIAILLLVRPYFSEQSQMLILLLNYLIIISISISLLTSFYIYDISKLYKFEFLSTTKNINLLNINAGFDDTSLLIKKMFPNIQLTSCDFYNSEKHTEISIKRARKAYPPLANSIKITTDEIPIENASYDCTLIMLSAHEIRDKYERNIFFKELNRITKSNGKIIVIEHLRDFNNFLAFSIAFFHFYSKVSWMNTFKQANLVIKEEKKITPFISTFILEKNGTTL